MERIGATPTITDAPSPRYGCHRDPDHTAAAAAAASALRLPPLLLLLLLLLLPCLPAAQQLPRCYRHEPDSGSCLLCGPDEPRGSPRCVHHQHAHQRTYLCHHLHQPFDGDAWLATIERTSARHVIKALSGPYGDMPECAIVGRGRIVESAHCPSSEAPPATDVNGLVSGVDCGPTCCRMADFVDGTFATGATGAGDDWPLTHVWEPRSGCKPLSLRPPHAVPCLRAAGVRRIVIVGDSLLRQLHNRFVSLSRKRRSTVDRHTWGNARYRLWAGHDMFEVGAEGLSPEEQEQVFRELMQPNTSSRIRLGASRQAFEQRLDHEALGEPLLEVLFIWCHRLQIQAAYLTFLHELSRELGPGFPRSSLIVGVWQHYRGDSHVLLPEEKGNFDKVLGLLAQPSPGLHRTYVLNGHTGFRRDIDAQSSQFPMVRQAEELNAYLAAWAGAVPHAVLLDYDALSRAEPFGPPTTRTGDVHFQCEVLAGATPPCITVNTHGGCTDSMNTVVVQLILNHMCNPHMRP